MMNNFMNGMFGKIGSGMCKLSMSGNIAVKTSNGYKSYNVKSGKLTNCGNFVFPGVDENFFFVIPTNKVAKGDIILVNGKPKCVIEADKTKITVINYEDSTVETILPERHVFMGNTYFYGKIVSMFGSNLGKDKEIEFKFHARKLEYIALFLKPAIAGADISPFSTKNLPKCNYPIPEEDLAEYNAILDSMDSKDYLLVSRVTDAFLTNKLQKSKQYRTIDLKKDMKKKCLKTKEYIHSLGEWNEYIEYLKKEICKCGSKD